MWNKQKQGARLALDQRRPSPAVAASFQPPAGGWVKAVREALGMTAGQLGARMDITQQRISDLERAELTGGVSLKSLRRVAEALECELVYALVPKVPLDERVRTRAMEIAAKELAHIGQTMALEDQAIDSVHYDVQLSVYIHDHISEKELWRDE